MNEILSVKNLSVRFEDKTVLDNINFSLEKRDSLCIIGPNGSGKTMLLRALLGIIEYEGTATWMPNVRIGYVPQKIDADRHLPVNFRNLLAAKAAVLRISPADVEEITTAIGLTDEELETSVGHLSGGQFQRALIAFALLGKPDVLILDEPTASIDKPGEEQVYELIHRLQDKYNIAVILVSHDLGFVYRYATKVLCLNKSGVCFGKPEEALTPEVLEKLYSGSAKFFHHLHPNE